MKEKNGSMWAVAPARPGGPDVLAMQRRPVPVPGPGQLLVKVAFAGINRHDCNQRSRGLPPPGATDILGLEVSGRVAAVGEGVERSVGQEVCALVNGGGYAEYCIAEADLALDLPQGVSLRDSAGLPEAIFTVWWNVFERARAKAGDWLLIHGGSSGIGTIGVQLAAAFGLKTIVTAGTEAKCAACLKLGAEVAINYKTEDFVERSLQATGGKGVDIILDTVGGLYAARNVAALAMDGRLLHLSPGRQDDFAAPLGEIMRRRAVVTGSLLRPLPASDKADLARVIRRDVWSKVGTSIQPVIDSVFALAGAGPAHRRMEQSGHVGKILLQVAS
jgi:putative PIG3 family NAD(P)H quinone oxidoreductase